MNPRVSRGFLESASRPGRHLRCVLFHDVASADSQFTRGLDVTLSPEAFERRVQYLKRHYDLVSLDEALDLARHRAQGERPLLVTFDDAYGSVARVAAPILRTSGVPWVLFANAAAIDDGRLLTDNLIAYAVNTEGSGVVSTAAKTIRPNSTVDLRSAATIISSFLVTLRQGEVDAFRAALLAALQTDPQLEARRQHLYLRPDELRSLHDSGFALASHTYSHAWGRSLDADDCTREIAGNANALASLTGTFPRAFSIPYGRSEDLTPLVQHSLQETGHRGLFVVEARTNARTLDLDRIFRVSMQDTSSRRCYVDLEVAPRLRVAKDRVVALAAATRRKSPSVRSA